MSHRLQFRIWLSAILLVVLTLPAVAQDNRTAASVDQIQAAIQRDPDNPKLYIELGLAYWDKNDSARAFEAFQQAVKMGPTSAEAHNWLGVALMERSDLPAAITDCSEISFRPFGRITHSAPFDFSEVLSFPRRASWIAFVTP